MVSYVDVLTILLIFFLTAAARTWKNPPAQTSRRPAASSSASTVAVGTKMLEKAGARQAERAAEQTAFDTGEQPDADRRKSESTLATVARKLRDEGLDVRPLANEDGEGDAPGQKGLAIDLSQAVLFSPGDDRVRAEALPDLRLIADALRGIPNKVNLAGHADATPIHNRRFRNNWELAAARSLRLMEVLTERYGIDEWRVSISSYGALDPKSPNDTPDGRANNRRVEVRIFQDAN
jgi:chemotaxis protein MotB